MSILNLEQEIKSADERIKVPEQRLGKELMMPFSPASSGARKIMFSTHLEHKMQIMQAEIPIISTGFENEFGRHSSTFKIADYDAEVIAKIPKFSNKPNLQYYMIILKENGELDVIDRVVYNHITETYGYIFNNDYLDSKSIGNTISKGDVLQKSRSFDDFNNRMDGVNLRTTYLACDKNTEDAIIISESAAKKLVSPLIKKVSIVVNDNDILLNLYGDTEHYKVFPDIGDEVQHGILAAMRKENKDESLYNQAYDRLRNIVMSDEKYIANGRVVDIDVYCNNPGNLEESVYSEQVKFYWDQKVRCCQQIVDAVDNMIDNGCTHISYDLQKLYDNAKKTINGQKFCRNKPFSNIGIDIVLLEELPLVAGDKISNRYGGKGVIGRIIPDEQMPRTKNGDVVELIYNQATGTNRLNLSQFLEYEINHFSTALIEWLSLGGGDEGIFDVGDTVRIIIDFIRCLNPEQADYWEDIISVLTDDELIGFINNIATDKGIMLSLMPISNNATIATIEKLIDKFPFINIHQSKLDVYIEGSDGKPRYVEAIRPVIVGYEYIYRLKQYAEEKFSTTSLSSTNLRGENSRSKAASQFKDVHAKTPVRFGEMETMASAHIGMDAVVFMLMLNATSPSARRRAEELLTNKTIDVDIKLGDNDSSRIVETLNAYLKTLGLRLTFEKIPKMKPMYLKQMYSKPLPRVMYEKHDWLPGEDPFLSPDGKSTVMYVKVTDEGKATFRKRMYMKGENPEVEDPVAYMQWSEAQDKRGHIDIYEDKYYKPRSDASKEE